MPSAKRAVALVVFLAVLGVVAGVLMPVGINQIESDQSKTINISQGDTVRVVGYYNATLDDATDTDINVTLNHTNGGGSASVTNLAEGSNETVTVDGLEFTINNTDSRADSADVKFTYPPEATMSNEAQSLWGLLGLALVLTVFLLAIRTAVDQS